MKNTTNFLLCAITSLLLLGCSNKNEQIAEELKAKITQHFRENGTEINIVDLWVEEESENTYKGLIVYDDPSYRYVYDMKVYAEGDSYRWELADNYKQIFAVEDLPRNRYVKELASKLTADGETASVNEVSNVVDGDALVGTWVGNGGNGLIDYATFSSDGTMTTYMVINGNRTESTSARWELEGETVYIIFAGERSAEYTFDGSTLRGRGGNLIYSRQ